MRQFFWVLTAALSLAFPAWSSGHDLSPREIYERASPAVVMVMGHAEGSGRKGSGGTGSIIRADGYVLTNAHVVVDEQTGRPYARLSVFLKPARVSGDSKTDLSRMVRARVVSYSQSLDLALLKLDGVTDALPSVELDDSSRTRIGDRVVAIGHPEQGGLWTLTTGVISAEVDNFNGVNGKNVFQTETGLNRGNSGGPLLDTDGRMIGVNTAIARVAPDGLPITSISFSLKSNVAAQWLREQGLAGRSVSVPAAGPTPETKASAEVPVPTVQLPPAKPAPGPQREAVAKPRPNSEGSDQPPVRPYNLDKLVDERAKAEADLTDMMLEMRERMRGR
ncbi:MAG TPA: trypsin-like peptidase domain-containing protein [Nitrospira sp.]|nr:trypsin-like peptidase domain-containing protein [Nitrospira sp.]